MYIQKKIDFEKNDLLKEKDMMPVLFRKDQLH